MDPEAPKAIISASVDKFGSVGGKFDVLVIGEHTADLDGIKAFTQAIGEVMKESGRGSILIIPGDVEVDQEVQSDALIDFTRNLAQEFEGTSITTNIILSEPTTAEIQQSAKVDEEAKPHMSGLMEIGRPAKDTPQSKQTPANYHQICNLALFLAGGMSEEVSGNIVSLDGSYRAL